jgi:RHS repeat-associated protein
MTTQYNKIKNSVVYYPFGVVFAEKFDNGTKQPYKYNGKELDQMHELNWYDSDARFYDPAIGRTPTIDPHAENYYAWSPYAWVGNNPIRITDPTGRDWYEDENGNAKWFRNQTTEEYEDEAGKIWTRTGSTYTTVVGNTLYHFEQAVNEEGNQYLRSSQYEIIDEKKARLQADKEAVISWQSSDASRSAQQKFWNNPTMGNWFKYVITEVASQYTDPNKVIAGASIGAIGLSSLRARSPKIQFGRVSNQVYHTFRHTNQLGLSQAAVTSAVQTDLRTIARGIQLGQAINRVITVGGQNLQYTVFKLSDGTLNVGRIHGI